MGVTIESNEKLETLSYTNIRGLSHNLNHVHHYLQSSRPGILFLSETQIKPNNASNSLKFPGYDLHSSFRFKGGVCAFVRNDLPCERTPNLETDAHDVL